MIVGLPSFGWTKNKILDLFLIQPQLFYFTCFYFWLVGWILFWPRPGLDEATRRAKRAGENFGYLGPGNNKNYSKIKHSGVAGSVFLFSCFFISGWLVGYFSGCSPDLFFLSNLSFFILPFCFSVGWLDTFLAGARTANWQSNSRALSP